jgi:hypothetical protein
VGRPVKEINMKEKVIGEATLGEGVREGLFEEVAEQLSPRFRMSPRLSQEPGKMYSNPWSSMCKA